MNKKFANFIFFLFLIFGIFSLIWSNFYHQKDFDLPILGKINADIKINVEVDEENLENIKLYAGNLELKPYIIQSAKAYVTYETINAPIYNINLEGDENSIKKIKDIVVFTGHKIHYFTPDDILKFEKTKSGKYLFPNNMKYLNQGSYITDKGKLKHLQIGVLSVFYNMKYYVFPIICFLISTLIYFFNKDKIELGFEIFKKNIIWLILLLGFLLRMADNSFPFWSDELYTATVAGNPNSPFSAVFSDPGNPPLFFIFARYQQKLFGANPELLRLLPCIFSTLTIGAIYIFVKENFSKKAGIFSSLIFAVNLYSIHSAQEFRCYSLCALFSVLFAHILFKIKKNEKENKNYFLYAILAILAANTHYFQILILIGNFLLALFILKTKRAKLKLFFANALGAIFFLPYFVLTALNKALLDESFNALVKPDFNYILGVYSKFYSNAFVAISVLALAILLIIPKAKKFFFENKNEGVISIYLYSIYSVLFLFFSSFVFSQFRPIIRQYYFINVLPFVIISISLIIFLPFKKKIVNFLLGGVVFLSYFVFGQYIEKEKMILVNFENVFKYAYYDSLRLNKNEIAIALHDTKNYSLFYKNYLRENTEYIMYPFLSEPDVLIDLIGKSNSKVVYLRLENRTFREFAQKLSKLYNVSIIRSDKDVVIARIIK